MGHWCQKSEKKHTNIYLHSTNRSRDASRAKIGQKKNRVDNRGYYCTELKLQGVMILKSKFQGQYVIYMKV